MQSWTTRFLANNYLWKEYFLHNIVESISSENDEDAIILVQGPNLYGDKVYAYIKLQMSMFFVVMQKLESKEKFDLRDYSEVIAAGQGDPNLDIRMEVEREHHMLPFAKK